jgi:hypothetical protein
VNLKKMHPDFFEDAKLYEKTALSHGSPFTWSQGEALTDLEKPERMAQIEADFEERKRRDAARRRVNPLHPEKEQAVDIDDLYLEDEGNGACLVCFK